MAHRIRDSFNHSLPVRGIGRVGRGVLRRARKNKHASTKLRAGCGDVGTTAVAGARDQDTGEIRTAVVSGTSRPELKRFANERVASYAEIYMDDHGGYYGTEPLHRVVLSGRVRGGQDQMQMPRVLVDNEAIARCYLTHRKS